MLYSKPVDFRKNTLENIKRVVLKIGSSSLTSNGRLDQPQLKRFARLVSQFMKADIQVVLVSSGAVASADFSLPGKTKKNLPVRQALASIGQVNLMSAYQKCLKKHGLKVGQVLLSETSLKDRESYLNARQTIEYLLHLNCVPIVNENDPVVTTELQFGDNDRLGAMVAGLIDADLYLIFSDIDGFYLHFGKKNQSFCSLVDKIDDFMISQAKGPSKWGTGGMQSKLLAAKLATGFGIPTLLTHGRSKTLKKDIYQGKGTFFKSRESANINKKKQWLSSGFKIKHKIMIDQGAMKAIIENGSSLLPSGVLSTKGNFHAGDICDVVSEQGKIIASGLVNLSSYEIKAIVGQSSTYVKKNLGMNKHSEVIHRNNLIVFSH